MRVQALAAATLCIASLACATSSQAALALTLSTASDLNNLTIGQTITFDVAASDVPVAGLEYLAATLDWNTSLLGIGPNILNGPIVPDGTGVTIPTTSPVDYFYDVIFANSQSPITQSGKFFQFDVQALTAGSGTIGILFSDATEVGSLDIDPINSAPLSFTVQSAVPEPSGLVLWGLMFMSAWVRFRGRLRGTQPY